MLHLSPVFPSIYWPAIFQAMFSSRIIQCYTTCQGRVLQLDIFLYCHSIFSLTRPSIPLHSWDIHLTFILIYQHEQNVHPGETLLHYELWLHMNIHEYVKGQSSDVKISKKWFLAIFCMPTCWGKALNHKLCKEWWGKV